MASRGSRRSLLGAVLLLVLYVLGRAVGMDLPMPDLSGLTASPAGEAARAPSQAPRAESGLDAEAGARRLAQLFRERRSDAWVEARGLVVATLPDDRKGSRHQRFILRVGPDQTVLVAHNIDLAERIPLKKGDDVDLRGQYEYTEKGGVMHWTHHDPENRHPGGWIEHRGRRYR